MKRLFFVVALFGISFSTHAQKKEMAQAFDANFEITSAKTIKAGEYECTASGEAGPYGRVYVTFHFTNKLNNTKGLGEFTGFGWSQTLKESQKPPFKGLPEMKMENLLAIVMTHLPMGRSCNGAENSTLLPVLSNSKSRKSNERTL